MSRSCQSGLPGMHHDHDLGYEHLPRYCTFGSMGCTCVPNLQDITVNLLLQTATASAYWIIDLLKIHRKWILKIRMGNPI